MITFYKTFTEVTAPKSNVSANSTTPAFGLFYHAAPALSIHAALPGADKKTGFCTNVLDFPGLPQ